MKTDIELRDDILHEFKWQPFLKYARIGVSVKKGVVTLSGLVDSFAQKQEAENAALKVWGVKGLSEDVRVSVFPCNKTDVEIAQTILYAFKWNSVVPADMIKVKVVDKIVTLKGEVDWCYQKKAAVNVVAQLKGVRNILNLITVKSNPIPPDAKSRIAAALERSAKVDAATIRVDVTGDRAILRGMVHSYPEKLEATEAAMCASGIGRVENFLEVEPQFDLVF